MKQARQFASEPPSVAAARRFTIEALAGAPAEVLEAIELMVSELATNSVRHARTDFQLTVSRKVGEIRVEVTDCAGGTPAMRSPGPEDPTGRGLRIVDMLSDSWGVERSVPTGKTVWFIVLAAWPCGLGADGSGSRRQADDVRW